MIHTLLINAIMGGPIQNGMVKLMVSDEQLEDLKQDIAAIQLPEVTPSIQDIRMFFFTEEGYMANDDICKAYWVANHDED